MNEPADLEQNQRDAVHARRSTRTLLAVLLGGGAALALVLGATIYWYRLHALPEVTQESYNAARALWEENQPASYELQVQLSGNLSDNYHVVVHEGDTVEVLYNGVAVRNPRTQKVWSVPGMFGTISEDLARCARQERAAEDPTLQNEQLPEPKLIVRAHFDEQYGYPAEYLRIELGGETDVSWEVTGFKVLEDALPPEIVPAEVSPHEDPAGSESGESAGESVHLPHVEDS